MTMHREVCSLRTGLTVVVPVYNVEAYVEQSIRSIFASNVKNLHVIAVDDHGTDGSMEVVRRLAAEDARLEIVSNDRNRGLAFSRNRGMEAVKTSHVAFLDSDDWVAPGFYERLMEAALRDDADIAAGQVLYVYPETGLQREEWVSWWSFRSGRRLLSSVEEKQDLIYACACWNKVYRTGFIRENGLTFPVGLFVEDVPFTFLATALANRISMVREAELFYRQRPKSIMKDLGSSKRIFDVFRIMDICYEHLECIPKEMRGEYRKVLDHFWIFNLHSWSTAVGDQDRGRFMEELRKRYRRMAIAGNPYVTSEHAQLYRGVLGIRGRYRVMLFGFIPLGMLDAGFSIDC